MQGGHQLPQTMENHFLRGFGTGPAPLGRGLWAGLLLLEQDESFTHMHLLCPAPCLSSGVPAVFRVPRAVVQLRLGRAGREGPSASPDLTTPHRPCLVVRPARVPRVGTSAALGSQGAAAGGAPGAGTQCPSEQLRAQELPALPTGPLPASSRHGSGPFPAPLPVGAQAQPPPRPWPTLYLVMLLLRAVFSVGERGPASQLQTSSLLAKPSQQEW